MHSNWWTEKIKRDIAVCAKVSVYYNKKELVQTGKQAEEEKTHTIYLVYIQNIKHEAWTTKRNRFIGLEIIINELINKWTHTVHSV